MVRFSGVTRNDLQHEILGLVTEAQDMVGHGARRKKGGRPRGSRQPQRQQKSKAAAFKRRAGEDWKTIATYLDVSVPTARRMVKTGEEMIAEEDRLSNKGRSKTH